MKTAMQELIDICTKEKYTPHLSSEARFGLQVAIIEATKLLEKEKEQLKKADINGANRVIYNSNEYGSNKLSLTFEEYYNQTYNQTNVGNDGFEFDNSSTIPPTKGLCDAKSIYGSELNK